jgi:hypothetical protein
MAKNMSINIGGPEDQEQATISLTVSGCSCRTEDFVMALVQFANRWKSEADGREIIKPPEGLQPCGGCKDKKKKKA